VCACAQREGGKRGQRCGYIELAAFLADAAGPVNLVMDLRIAHERWGSSSNPVQTPSSLPADTDKPLHDATSKKIREYRAD
jgi:hypothetical protein